MRTDAGRLVRKPRSLFLRMPRRITPEQIFVAVALFAGILCALLTPPFRGADERAHFCRAYQISKGGIVPERQNEGVGGVLPWDLRSSQQRAASRQDGQSLPPRAQAQLTPRAPGERLFVDFRNTALFAPVSYLPQALAIGAGRVTGAPLFILLYFGRFAGLLASLGLIGLAIRLTPVGKLLLLLLAVTPMSIRQMSLLTADSVANASAFLLIAMFLRLALDADARLRGRGLLSLILCSLVVSLSKQAYFPLLLLYFLCPVEKAGGWRRYVATFLGIAGLNALALTMWLWAIRSLYVPQCIAPAADPTRQMAFILSAPLGYLRVLRADLQQHGMAYVRQCFSYVGHPPRALGWLHLAALVFVALFDSGREFALGVKAKVVICGAFVLTLVLVTTLNYLAWSPVAAGSISGIQGRYYIPITPLPFLLLSNRRLGAAGPERRVVWLAAGFAAFVAFVTVRFLVLRWYGV